MCQWFKVDFVRYVTDCGIINKSGAWYACDGNKIGQGRENAKQYLKDNPEFCAEVESKVRAHYALQGSEKETEGVEAMEDAKEKGKASEKKAAKA